MLTTPIKLPCGVTLANRLVKAAITERISNSAFEPTADHERLYRLWSNSGAGLLITGNVIIDRTHLESAGNVVFDDEDMLPALQAWAQAAQASGNACWVQISHAGRQTNRFSTGKPKAPSTVQLRKLGLFGRPVAMTQADIEQVIAGFVRAAKLAQDAGFGGVQIHAAHGYLLSQFLSPNTNFRDDKWGGSLENRSRLLLTIIKQMREVVGANFPISVKLNSADFQRGGFSEEDSLEVVQMLDKAGIDLLEISGGTYEKLAFFLMNDEEHQLRESTRKREAYFIDFARKVRAVSKLPLMITGGFRSRAFCEEVLANGEVDLIGMARPFITNADDIAGFLSGEVSVLENRVVRTGLAALEDAAEGGFYARQLIRLAQGKAVNMKMNALWASNFLIIHELQKTISNRMG
ncbi:MAG: NADH:flavin oxidoreductase/NADH oxidase family protein [Bacteroidota bacterium]